MENERIAKEREDQRRTIAYLQDLLQKQLGGNIDVLLPCNLKVPVKEPILPMPSPSLAGIPSIAFPTTSGAFGLLLSSVVASESSFPQKMRDNSSYPQVENNSLVSPLQSLSPMHTDPRNLCFSPPANWASPVVDRALDFDADSESHRL